MIVIFTKKTSITSKKGDQWVKACYVSLKDGQTGEIFVSAKEFEAFSLPDDRFMTPESLKDAFKDATESEVQFDQRGRADSVE